MSVINKWHVNPKTGKVGVCRAKIQCRFGGRKEHYRNEADALAAFERTMFKEEHKISNPGTVTLLPDSYLKGSNKIALPAGEYFLGDPYEILGLDEEGWNQWVDAVDRKMGWENNVSLPEEEKKTAVGALYNNQPVTAIKTWKGDGMNFSLSPTRKTPTETGMIGAIPISLIKELGFSYTTLQKKKMGMFYRFEEPVEVYRNEFGDVQFGDCIVIIPVEGNEDSYDLLQEQAEIIDSTEDFEENILKFNQNLYAKVRANRDSDDDYFNDFGDDDYYDVPDDWSDDAFAKLDYDQAFGDYDVNPLRWS